MADITKTLILNKSIAGISKLSKTISSNLILNKNITGVLKLNHNSLLGFSNVNSMLFDGINKKIVCGNDASLTFERTDSFSFSFWIKRGRTGVLEGILNKFATFNPVGYVIFINLANNLLFRIANDQTTNAIERKANTTLFTSTSVWYHVVCTYDGSSDVAGLKIYVNGVEETYTNIKNTLTDTIINAQSFRIGLFNPTFAPFNGNIDEVSAWKKELSQTDVDGISANPNNLLKHSAVSDLVGWWRMGDKATFDGNNWTFPDQSINNNIGTSVNMIEADRSLIVP